MSLPPTHTLGCKDSLSEQPFPGMQGFSSVSSCSLLCNMSRESGVGHGHAVPHQLDSRSFWDGGRVTGECWGKTASGTATVSVHMAPEHGQTLSCG